MDFDEFVEIVRTFDREGVEYVLVGGIALNLHGVLRATEDVDFFVEPSVENLGRLRRALRGLYDDPELDGIRDEDLLGDYPTLRYGPPDRDLVIDVIARIGTRFTYADLDAEIIEVRGVPVRVATAETLIRMKSDTVRPIDRADVEALRTLEQEGRE